MTDTNEHVGVHEHDGMEHDHTDYKALWEQAMESLKMSASIIGSYCYRYGSGDDDTREVFVDADTMQRFFQVRLDMLEDGSLRVRATQQTDPIAD